MGLSFDKIATNLNINQSTARRITNLFSATESVTKKSYDKPYLPRKVTNVVQCFILQLVLQCPGITLRKIKSNVSLILQVEIDESTICRFLLSRGFTRQKMQIIARQRDDHECAVYAAEMSVYNPEMLIFLNETGFDKRNVLRRYAYSFTNC